jgi:TP901 family phage tail tape measure protein
MAVESTGVKIFIDTDGAQKSVEALTEKNVMLINKLNELIAAGKGHTAAANKYRQAIAETEKEQGKYIAQMREMDRVMNNLATVSTNKLKESLRALRKAEDDAERGTKEQIAATRQRIAIERELADRLRETSSVEKERMGLMGRAAGAFNKYFALVTTAIGSITGLSFAFRRVAEDLAKMDDVYADVMKTTGLSKDQVVELNEAFKKMNTRTSREELNLLARDAGKLGVSSKKDILGFVEAGNQIRVALGEDLGDEAIKDVGKIVEVFKKAQDDLKGMDLKGQMLAVGSAINELGQSSTASESYMVNFVQRMGGVASQAGISVQNVLGFASALDQLGQSVEMSATALQKFLMKLMEDPAKFARLAGLEVKQFSRLLAVDANAAVQTVLAALGNKGGFQALVPVFKDMGLDGARAVGVLSSLASGIDEIGEAQVIANRAFAEGISITNEYGIKNNTLLAKLERAKKEFREAGLSLGEYLNPVLLKSTNFVTYLIKALAALPAWWSENSRWVLSAAASVSVYTVAVNASIIATRVWIVVNTLLVKATGLLRVALNGLKSHPVIALASAIVGLISYFGVFRKRTDELNSSQKALRKTLQEVADMMSSISGLERRGKVISNLNRRQVEELKSSAEAELAVLEDKEARFLERYKVAHQLRVKEISESEAADAVKAGLINKERNRLLDLIKAETGFSNEELVLQKKRLKNTIDIANKRLDELSKVEGVAALSPELGVPESPVADEDDGDRARLGQLEDRLNEEQKVRLQSIERWRQAEGKRESEYRLALAEDELYDYGRRVEAYELFQSTLSSKSKSVAAEASKRVAENGVKQLQAERKVDQERLSLLEESRNVQLGVVQESYDKQLSVFKKFLAEERITQEQYDILMLSIGVGAANLRLDVQRGYAEEVHRLNLRSGDLQVKAVEASAKAVREADVAAAEERAKQLRLLRDTESYFAKEFGLLTPEQESAIQLKTLSGVYEARRDFLLANGASVERLTRDFEHAKTRIVLDAEEKRQSLLREYGLLSWEEEHRVQLDRLKLSHDMGLLSESEYQESLLGLRMDYAGKYFDYYSGLFSGTVSGLQEAEISGVESNKEKELSVLREKYGAGIVSKEEYESEKSRIDNEAAEKKLDIEKKYADVNFAIKVSEIVANTAAAIMQAFAQLGPVGGVIASALMTATGAAQVAAANAERERVRSMTLDGSVSGGVERSQRVVLPGLEEGGYVSVERSQDGRRFFARRRRRRGYVEEPSVLVGESGSEFVANHEAVRNPDSRVFLDVIDSVQRGDAIRRINFSQIVSAAQRMRGFSAGGYTGVSSSSQVSPVSPPLPLSDELTAVLTEVRVLLGDLKKGVKAFVVLSELQQQEDRYERSKGYGSR